MRCLSAAALLGSLGALVAGFPAHAESANTRVASMPFAECLSIIAEVSQELGEEPVRLVNSDDLTTVRIPASDGFVTVSCSRPDSQMTLSRSAVPAAAGMTAAAGEETAP